MVAEKLHFSYEIQNDLLKIVALCVLRSIAGHFQKPPAVTVLINITADISSQEQVTVIIR